MTSCRSSSEITRERQREVEQLRVAETDTILVRDTLTVMDTVRVRDTVSVWKEGDTVYIRESHWNERSIEHRRSNGRIEKARQQRETARESEKEKEKEQVSKPSRAARPWKGIGLGFTTCLLLTVTIKIWKYVTKRKN